MTLMFTRKLTCFQQTVDKVSDIKQNMRMCLPYVQRVEPCVFSPAHSCPNIFPATSLPAFGHVPY